VSRRLDRLADKLRDQAPDRIDRLFDEVLMPKRKRPAEPMADTIRATIRSRGLSAYAVAQLAGINATPIQRFMNGERGISLRTAEKIAAALDMVLVQASAVVFVEARTTSKPEKTHDSRS
jgi:hypothetical protein